MMNKARLLELAATIECVGALRKAARQPTSFGSAALRTASQWIPSRTSMNVETAGCIARVDCAAVQQ